MNKVREVTILNKSENATLQLSIFCEKVLYKKYLLKLNNFSHRLMSEFCSFKCLKLYSLIFAIAHAQVKMVMLIKIDHNCVA